MAIRGRLKQIGAFVTSLVFLVFLFQNCGLKLETIEPTTQITTPRSPTIPVDSSGATTPLSTPTPTPTLTPTSTPTPSISLTQSPPLTQPLSKPLSFYSFSDASNPHAIYGLLNIVFQSGQLGQPIFQQDSNASQVALMQFFSSQTSATTVSIDQRAIITLQDNLLQNSSAVYLATSQSKASMWVAAALAAQNKK